MSNNTLVGTRRASIEPQTRADRTPPGHGVYRSARRRTAVVAVFYTLLYLIYFSPALISGRLLAPGDGVAYSLPVYLSPKSSWTPLLFSGYPLLADPQVMGFYPVARLLALFPNSWNLFVLSAYILASVWTFCLVRALTRSDFGALIGGTLYGMSGFFMAHLGHTNMIHSAAWLPLILLAAVKLRTRYSPAWLAAGAFAVAMSILAGHPQIAVYALGLTAAYALSRGWYAPAGRWRYGLALAAMVLLGVGLSAVQLLPAQELAKLSPRAAMDYLNHIHPNVPPRQLMTLLFPYLLGEVWDSIYHLPYVGVFNIAEVSGYVGLLPLMLVMIAVLRRRAGAEVWFWAIVAIVALMLATGGATPLAHLTHLLPGYRSFRAPSRHLLEFTLAMSILAGFGVAHLQDCPARRRRELWAVGLFILGFFAVLAAILLGHQRIAGIFLRQASLSWTSHPLKNNAVGIPILVALAGSMAMALWILRPRRWSQAVLLTVLVGDLATFGWVCEWNNPHAPTAQGLQMPASLAHYRQAAESESQRVLALRGMFASPAEAKPNLPMLWGMRSSGGYSPLRPWRYQRLLGMNEVGVLALDWAADPAEPVLATGRALDLLATRYVLGPSHQSRREGFLDRDGRSYAPEDLPTALLRRSDETPPAQAAFEVSPFHATEIDLVTNLKGGRELPDGAPRAGRPRVDRRRPGTGLRAARRRAYGRAGVRPDDSPRDQALPARGLSSPLSPQRRAWAFLPYDLPFPLASGHRPPGIAVPGSARRHRLHPEDHPLQRTGRGLLPSGLDQPLGRRRVALEARP